MGRKSISTMHILLLILALSVVGFSYSYADTGTKTNVAVMDLDISGGVPEIYQRTLSDRLRLELVNTDRYVVIERNIMEDILKEQGFQISGCTSDECAVQMGRILGVESMIAGSIGKVGNTFSIILRHINVESGRIIDSKGVDCNCSIDEVMSTSIKQVARLIAGLEAGSGKSKTPVSGEGDLLVKSIPSGAMIFLDEEKIKGTTPLAIEKISKGEHTLRLELDDLVGSTLVDIVPGQINRVEVSLEKAAELHIDCSIRTANLKVNGKDNEEGFPQTLAKLTPGTYEIEVSAEGYKTFNTNILLKPKQKESIEVELERQQGVLSFKSLPKGTVVYLDDKKLGVSPLRDENVTTGWHIIKLDRKGYVSSGNKDIKVENNAIFEVEYDLERIVKRKIEGSALPASFLWPGLGQIRIGRKFAGITYALGEAGAVGFLLYAVSDYNAKVDDYNTALDAYDSATTNFMALYDARVKAHDDAESAKSMVMMAGGIAGGIYLWNIIDGVLFSGDSSSGSSSNDGQGIMMGFIPDSQGKPVAGLSFGITFGSKGRNE